MKTATELLAAIRRRYPSDRFAFFPGLRNCTGFASNVRTADAVVMGLWPSRGLDLTGLEIKVSRSDWLRELAMPEKAEEIQRYCDFWYVVAPRDVLQDDELPSTWGWLVPRGRHLVANVKAPKLEPVPLDRDFLAAVLRNAASDYVDWIPRSEIKNEVDEARDEGRKIEKKAHKHTERELARHKRILAEFEADTGVHLNDWNKAEVGKAVKIVLDGEAEIDHAIRRIRTLHQQATHLVEVTAKANEVAEEMEKKDGALR